MPVPLTVIDVSFSGIKGLFVAKPYGLNISSPSQSDRINDVQHEAPHESQSILAMRDDDDSIDLRPMFAQIWKARKIILTGTIIMVVIALFANEFLAKYWSEGHFKINNISPTAYKSFQPVFLDVDRFRAYVIKEGISDKESAIFIEGLVSLSPEQLERYASIVKSISSRDGKEDVAAKGRGNESEARPVFIGMDLKMPGPSPVAAQLRSRVFAEYFADTFIYVDLLKWLDSVGADWEAAAYSNKLEAIQIQRNIDEENMRLVALRSLTKRFPAALRVEGSPLISVDVKNDMSGASKGEGNEGGRRRIQGEGFERFLSPVAQIVAAESSIMDGKIDLLKLQRKQKQSDVAHEFYKQAAAIRATTNSGRELIKKLIELKDVFLRDISESDMVGAEVVNEISHELEQRQFRYASGFKFLSGPSLPEGKSKKNSLLIAFGAGAGGMFLMVVLALLMSWWQKNAKSLSDDNGLTATAI